MSTSMAKPKVHKAGSNHTKGRLFFLDLSAGPSAYRKSDGSDLKAIVSEGRRLPDGIVVDVAAGHIYWTNMGHPSANDGSIERADLDGKNLTHIIPLATRSPPSNSNSTKKMASFIGRTRKACA